MPANINKINMPITLQAGVSKSTSLGDMFSADMAQSRYFIVNIEANGAGGDENDSASLDTINTFKGIKALPIKNISYTITGIDSMILPIGVFKDIPIPVGKKLPRITLTLHDTRTDNIEQQIRLWYSTMMPVGAGIASYLDDMIATLTYDSYSANGDLNYSYRAKVMLTDDFTMSRDYESNSLKTMEISLIVLDEDPTVVNLSKPLSKPEPLPEPTNNLPNSSGPIQTTQFNIDDTVQPIFGI